MKARLIIALLLGLCSPILADDFPGGVHVQGVQDAGHSASAQFPVLVAGQDSSGNVVVLKVNSDGTLNVANAVITNPSTIGRNTVQPQSDTVEALTLKRHSATQTANHLQWQDETGSVQGKIEPGGRIDTPTLSAGIAHGIISIGGLSPIMEEVGSQDHATQQTSARIGIACQVDPNSGTYNPGGNFYGSCALNYSLYNLISGVSPIYGFGIDGQDDNAGNITNAHYFMFDGTGNGVYGLVEEGGTARSSIGVLTPVFDGMLTLQSTDDAKKGLVVRPFSTTQTGNEAEFQNSAGTPQTILAGNGRDWILDTTTGTKWGTASTQKEGWWGATPVIRQTVTGSRGGNAALASLLTALATEGLIVDNSTP